MITKFDFGNVGIVITDEKVDKKMMRCLGINERENMEKIKEEPKDKETIDRLRYCFDLVGDDLYAFVSKTKKYVAINYIDNDLVFDNSGNCFVVDSDGYYIDENEEMHMVEEKREKDMQEFLKNQNNQSK